MQVKKKKCKKITFYLLMSKNSCTFAAELGVVKNSMFYNI